MQKELADAAVLKQIYFNWTEYLTAMHQIQICYDNRRNELILLYK